MSTINFPMVTEEIVKKAVYNIYNGKDIELINFECNFALQNVQGFSSQIVNINGNIKNKDTGINENIKLIGKCLPAFDNQESDRQKDTIERFKREYTFFKYALPSLLKHKSLSVVKCYHIEDTVLIMEDLKFQGYDTLTKSMKDVGTILLKYSHMKILIEKLAEFNATSLYIKNWIELIPLLKTQNLFCIDTAENSIYTLCIQAFRAYSQLLINDETFMNNKNAKIVSKWLTTDEPFNTLIKFSSPSSSNGLTVLTHGDFWINNMMFKLDNNEPVDVKLIDFQLYRLSTPSKDILHVMYTCLDKKFRDQYENDLLQLYVKSFNKTIKEEKLNYENFKLEYNEARIFGCLLAVIFRTINLMSDIYPEENENITQEIFEGMLTGDQYSSLLTRFKNNISFRQSIYEVIDELLIVASHYITKDNN